MGSPGNPILIPIGSMYGIFTYIWVIYRANISKYSIHGASGIYHYKPVPLFSIFFQDTPVYQYTPAAKPSFGPDGQHILDHELSSVMGTTPGKATPSCLFGDVKPMDDEEEE